MTHFKSLKEFNHYVGYTAPKKELIDVVKYDEFENLRLKSEPITTDWYMMAFKRNVTGLHCFGSTEFDRDAAFLYFVKPNQVFEWDATEPWKGYHMLISPVLLQEYNIDFSFFQYEIGEALFLTEDEQQQLETLYEQILTEYKKDTYELDLLIAYSNLIFTYIGKCYKRQFETRQPLYNKVVMTFKKELNKYYSDGNTQLPSVNYFAEKLNLSVNYFGDLIKHHTGKTASELIQEKIIIEAKHQLQSYDKSIAEIGYNLGFDYPTYFSRLFKKHTGVTPSQYRR
ncbi:AraC family transcriptional regulator [Flagellimonas marinaquae]|jgi:AraC-like DNA-binding protein|uniref:AraC family transcriptional regulator n=1 Tax=Flagellimonas marinaquae TaxID=254955 RepID=A0AA48HB83_9FLAO|nr:helix-turn-helix domain-containing protein [Allomuricauda aquimarina]USD24681.1 helix-turn-helix domain-containing protein [Allomuricauda aquimarina]BDW93684.1 AraC family transcriptional regulator [Allomuricauda aquimarina]